jgi:hypothetical protein
LKFSSAEALVEAVAVLTTGRAWQIPAQLALPRAAPVSEDDLQPCRAS